MSNIKVDSIIDLNGGNEATINGYTPTESNMAGKNRIINGDMRIDQRNAGASKTITTVEYTLDRWLAIASLTSKFSVQQNAGSVTPPEGFASYLGCTSLSAYSVGAIETFSISQRAEGFNVADLGWGTANAKAITIGFWVRSSLTGTFGGSLRNSASDRSYPYTYTISAADTWEYKSVTVAGDTSGTWLTTNGTGIEVIFGLGSGADRSGTAGAWAGANYTNATGATSVVGTSGATFYITGVQLEAGTVATPFERRQYGQELALCQRYYQKFPAMLHSGYAGASTIYYSTFLFPVELRAAPTISYSNFTNSNSGNASTNSVGTKVLRVQATMTSLGNGFSIFDAETSGAEL